MTMIIWKCDVCGKESEHKLSREGWEIHHDIVGQTVDLCPECADMLLDWLKGRALIVPLVSKGAEERCRRTESH